MRAIVCHQWGPPDSLALQDIPDPKLGSNDVLIDVAAAAVNFPDVLIIENKYQFKPELPFIPGSELAGTVAAVGSEVSHFHIGQRVIALPGQGAFAQRVAVPASHLMPMPDAMDFDTGAAMTLTYGTSYHAIVDRAQLQPGETMLVLGAAGGVGLAAIEIGKAVGARVIAAASSPEKLALCKQHGADDLIDYSTEDLRDAIKRLTDGRGPNVIYDPVGGPYTEPAFRSIAWRGRYLVIGFAHGDIPKLPLNLPLLKGASLVGVFWGEFVKREPKAHAVAMRQLLAWHETGKIKPHVSHTYALGDTAQALKDMAARRVTGKIVIHPAR